jgi:hypothetical protein
MATDRFIWFGGAARVPARDDVAKLLEDFVDDAGYVAWNNEQSRFYITLYGVVTDPLRCLCERGTTRQAMIGADENGLRPRWIEVHIGEDNIDVITRHMDAFTMCVADGITRSIARHWDGWLDEQRL